MAISQPTHHVTNQGTKQAAQTNKQEAAEMSHAPKPPVPPPPPPPPYPPLHPEPLSSTPITTVKTTIASRGPGCVATRRHQQEHQAYLKMLIIMYFIAVMWGPPSVMIIRSLRNSTEPPEMEVRPPKLLCGCPCGNCHIRSPVTLWNRCCRSTAA